MRAMNQMDVHLLASLHRDHPRRCTLFTVALALVRYRAQKQLDASPAELARMTGADYGFAKKAMRDARKYLEALADGVPGVPQGGGTSNTPMGYPEYPKGGTPNTPSGVPGVPQGGYLEYPTHNKEEKEEEVCALTRAHAREEPEPEVIPNGPSPEADRRAVVRFVGDVTAGALEPWASQVCEVYPAPWVRALVERKVLGQPMPRATLLNAILQSWARSGSCEYLDQPILPLRPTGTANGSPSAPMSAAERRRLALRADVDSWELPE